MTEHAYMNARGETVVPYHVFKQMSARAIEQAAAKQYPHSCKCNLHNEEGKHAKDCQNS